MIRYILGNQHVSVITMLNCNYNVEQTVIMTIEEQLTQRIISISKSKHASIQPEYPSSAFFTDPGLSVSFFQNKNVPLGNNLN